MPNTVLRRTESRPLQENGGPSSTDGRVIDDPHAVFRGGSKLFCKFRFTDMPSGLGEQKVGAGFHSRRRFGKEMSGRWQLMHDGECKGKVDCSFEVVKRH